ncbi:MAG: hypothetical protein HP491_06645 [Nitrospira sp.]|nr:hypothetical protein [Nitrospira sp.]
MKILVVGGGGREHTIVWKLAQSPRKPVLFCAPGNAGIESIATCVSIKADDIAALKDFVIREQIDFTVVGPEAPLALGIVDEFRRAKLKIFGPTKNAARLEASKIFSKDVMAQAKIPTARAKSFDKVTEALAYLEQHELPVVIKADGLAQGKGVIIATTREQAREAIVSSIGLLQRFRLPQLTQSQEGLMTHKKMITALINDDLFHRRSPIVHTVALRHSSSDMITGDTMNQ